MALPARIKRTMLLPKNSNFPPFYFQEYCLGLGFSQKPDYNYLRGLFRSCLRKKSKDEEGEMAGNLNGDCFEWNEVKKEEGPIIGTFAANGEQVEEEGIGIDGAVPKVPVLEF